MAITVSDSGGGNFTPHPVGLHQMVCCDVIDNGLCETAYGPKRKVTVRWESQELTDKGQRMTVQQRYTASLNEKARLRHDLESWRGKAFTGDELAAFDLEKLIGVNCMVNVVQRADAKGKLWANPASLAPLMRGLEKMAVSQDYVRQSDREPEPNETAQHDGGEVNADSIPF